MFVKVIRMMKNDRTGGYMFTEQIMAQEDADKARQVLEEDDEVDAIYGEILRGSIAFMRADPSAIEDGMRVSNCAKYVERIGDHATNIAEMVIFLVDGVDVRHGGKT